MSLVQPVLYGLAAAAPLVAGAVVGTYWRPPRQFVAAALAFASGSLVTGIAFELFAPAARTAGTGLAAAGLLTGTAAYVGIKAVVPNTEGVSGPALLATVIVDGTAENLTLGVVLAGGGVGGPLAILLGVAANNLPEAIGGATGMLERGRSANRILLVWTATAVGLAAVVPVGYVALSGAGPAVLGVVRAVGGGGVLASLAIEIMPDAYEEGGYSVAFATATGFVATFALL